MIDDSFATDGTYLGPDQSKDDTAFVISGDPLRCERCGRLTRSLHRSRICADCVLKSSNLALDGAEARCSQAERSGAWTAREHVRLLEELGELLKKWDAEFTAMEGRYPTLSRDTWFARKRDELNGVVTQAWIQLNWAIKPLLGEPLSVAAVDPVGDDAADPSTR